MMHGIAQDLMHGSRVGGVTIRRHPFWSMSNNGESLLEKLLGGFHISLLTQVAIRINGSIQITPLSVDLDGGFIYVPGLACLSTPFGPQLLWNEWSKSLFPLPDRLIAELPPTFQKHLSEISQAQLVPKSPQDNQKDHIGRIFQEVERCSCALIEEVFAS